MLRFKGADLRPVIAEAIANKCGLSLLTDEGVYLIADIGEDTPDGRRKLIAYAVGCDPDIDHFDAWSQTVLAELGEEDFIGWFDVQEAVFQRILNSDDDLQLFATQTHLSIAAVPPR